MKDFKFCIPTCFIVGKGSAAKVGEEIRSRGGKRVLVVHDGGSYLESLLKTVRASIEACGIVWLEMERKATSPSLSFV